MPAVITHHIFGEDVVCALPEGIVEGEEEMLAFLLANQGPDPLAARLTAPPSRVRTCRELGRRMQGGRVTSALLALREGVRRLPVADERIGRAFALGLLGHYALDRTAHPFVVAQQLALAEADPSLAGSMREVHAVIESDIDVWILWEKRRATVVERPAAANLMRTPRVDRVGGALFSQVAYCVYGISLGAGEYGACVADYERVLRVVDPARSRSSRVAGTLERLVRGRSLAEALAHYERRSDECPAANLERHAWTDPFTGETRHDSFADLFDEARLAYPALAEAFVRGSAEEMRGLVAGLNYEGRPATDE